MKRLFAAAPALLWILCVGPAPPARADQKVADKSAIAATVDGVAITDVDLDIQGEVRQLEQQGYEMRMRALDGVIWRRLLERAAAARKLTVDEFLKQEVDEKIAPPSPEELQAFYLARREEFQKPFEDVREQVDGRLKSAKMREAQRALALRLRDQSSIEILLRPPRFTVKTEAAPRRGLPSAPVTIVEFSDFECPVCQKTQTTLREVLAKYGDRVSMVYKDLPLTQIHGEAQPAAEAARCAGEQGKYWEYHDALFAARKIGRDIYQQTAERLGLEAGAFQKCVESRKHQSRVEADMREGFALGTNSTPTFLVNGILLKGGHTTETFSKVIDAELQAARRGAAGPQ